MGWQPQQDRPLRFTNEQTERHMGRMASLRSQWRLGLEPRVVLADSEFFPLTKSGSTQR